MAALGEPMPPKRAAGSGSFYAGACGDGLGRWPLQETPIGRHVRLRRARLHQTNTEPLFRSSQQWLAVLMLTAPCRSQTPAYDEAKVVAYPCEDDRRRAARSDA